MAMQGGLSVPGQATTPATNWTTMRQETTDECSGLSGDAKTQCRANKRSVIGTSTTTTPGAAEKQYGLGGGSFNPKPYAPPTAGGGYDAQIAAADLGAPAGTFAAGLGTYGLGAAGSNPAALTQNYMATRYGVAPNSMPTQMVNKYLAPTADRMLGILGEIPGSNIDAVNFGAALMDHFSGTLGHQLDPKRMTATITAGIQGAAGMEIGPEDVGTNGGFAAVANAEDPLQGIDTLISMLKGALAGTMPQEAMDSWLSSLAVYATQLVTGQGGLMGQTTDQIAGDVGAGNDWFNKLVNTLGPTLGL